MGVGAKPQIKENPIRSSLWHSAAAYFLRYDRCVGALPHTPPKGKALWNPIDCANDNSVLLITNIEKRTLVQSSFCGIRRLPIFLGPLQPRIVVVEGVLYFCIEKEPLQ